MIRIRHLALPPGLSALLRRTPTGDLEIFLSDGLDPRGQRAAVRVALQSSRQAGWRAGLLPIPLVLLLAASRSGIRAATRALRLHSVASAAVAGVVAASAATLIVVLPHHHTPLSAGRLPSPGLVHPAAPGRTSASPHSSRSPRPEARSLPRRTATQAPIPTAVAPAPGQNSVTASSGASPVPTSSGITSSSPTPTTSQSPSSGGQPCIEILGIWVCL